MFDLDTYSKIRQAQMQEYIEMNNLLRRIQRKPSWSSQIVGKALTRFGAMLLGWGRKMLPEATDVDLHTTPRSIHFLSE